jgi:hypothetical protein
MVIEDILDRTAQFLIVCCCLKILDMPVVFSIGVATIYIISLLLFCVVEVERE